MGAAVKKTEMNFVKLVWDVKSMRHVYDHASSTEMAILGCFFATDARCSNVNFFKEWALADKEDPKGEFGYSIGGNISYLEEKNNDIYFDDSEIEDKNPTTLKMTKKQFIDLLDDWQELVCKTKPKEVIIKHEHGHFFIETSDLKWEHK
jgi:hypothetical protein